MWVLLEYSARSLANNADGSSNMETIVIALNEIGYLVWYDLVNSNRHGVPQRRERVWILAVRVGGKGTNQLRPKCSSSEWHKQAALHIKLLERKPLCLS